MLCGVSCAGAVGSFSNRLLRAPSLQRPRLAAVPVRVRVPVPILGLRAAARRPMRVLLRVAMAVAVARAPACETPPRVLQKNNHVLIINFEIKLISLEVSLSRKTVSRIYVSGCIHTHHGVGGGANVRSEVGKGQHAGAIPELHAHAHAYAHVTCDMLHVHVCACACAHVTTYMCIS